MPNQLRFTAICLGLAAQMICCQAENFYVAQKNAVYITEARQLQLGNSALLPLALIRVHWGWQVAVFHKDLQSVELLEFADVCKIVRTPDLRPESILISEGKLYEKFGPLQFFKQYPTDAYDGALNVTAVPRANRIFVTLEPYQKDQFEGSTCIVTDTKTKKDVHMAHRISEVYTYEQSLLTWISDQTVLAFEYAYRGNGGYYIDIKNDTRTSGWSAVDGAQYFLFDGSDLSLYLPNGPLYRPKITHNFVTNVSAPSVPSIRNLNKEDEKVSPASQIAASLLGNYSSSLN